MRAYLNDSTPYHTVANGNGTTDWGFGEQAVHEAKRILDDVEPPLYYDSDSASYQPLTDPTGRFSHLAVTVWPAGPVECAAFAVAVECLTDALSAFLDDEPNLAHMGTPEVL
jgi:hypothetical protein